MNEVNSFEAWKAALPDRNSMRLAPWVTHEVLRAWQEMLAAEKKDIDPPE